MNTQNCSVRVLIVDDHPVIIRGLRDRLHGRSGLEVVGTAEDAVSALKVIRTQRPDVVLLDLYLPDRSGLSLLKELKASADSPRVIMMTSSDDVVPCLEALRMGAEGYLLKGCSMQLFESAILVCGEGGALISGTLALEMFSTLHNSHRSESPEFNRKLTRREAQVLELAASGHSNRAISEKLFIAASTVKKYMQSIRRKLGVRDRNALAARCQQAREAEKQV